MNTLPSAEAILYREKVFALMKSKSSALVSNGAPEHAAALFECFFMNATRSVTIFCRNLSPAVFGRPEVIAAAVGAVSRDVKLDIVCQEEPVSPSKFRETVSKTSPNSIRVFPNLEDFKENFAIMDGCAFRYEDDSSKVNAVASMNRPDLCARLLTIFGHLTLQATV